MSRNIDGTTWLTVAEVAARLQLHRNTVLALVWDGRLPAKRLARNAWHVKDVDVAAWLSQPDNVRRPRVSAGVGG